MNGTIWGGCRVRVTTWQDPSIPAGIEGINLGRRKVRSGAVTLVIRLEDGREVRLPLSAVERVETQYIPDALVWKAPYHRAGRDVWRKRDLVAA